jgi:predicted PurR-regulated permease PerM
MKQHTYVQTAFFITIFVIVAVLAFLVFAPFLHAIVLGTVAAIALQPLQKEFLRVTRQRRGLAAFLSILLTICLVGIPVTLISTQVFEESSQLYSALSSNGGVYLENFTRAIEGPIQRYAPYFNLDVQQYTADLFGWITDHVGVVISGTLQIVLGTILTIVITFFFLRDGAKIAKTVKDASPLDDDYDDVIFTKVYDTITAIVRGLVALGVIQGILVGVGLWIFGVPNATLWGTFAAFAAMVPGLGTALVNIPAILFLLASNEYIPAIGLTVWAALIVGTIDNVLAPLFYSRGVHVHPVVILLAVLGGLATYGLLGFIYGPVIVTLFLALMFVYKEQMRKKGIE